MLLVETPHENKCTKLLIKITLLREIIESPEIRKTNIPSQKDDLLR